MAKRKEIIPKSKSKFLIFMLFYVVFKIKFVEVLKRKEVVVRVLIPKSENRALKKRRSELKC